MNPEHEDSYPYRRETHTISNERRLYHFVFPVESESLPTSPQIKPDPDSSEATTD